MLDFLKKDMSAYMGRHVKRLHATAHIVIPAMMIFIAVLISAADVSIVSDFQFMVFDKFQRESPRAYDPETPVRIIDLDDQSLAELGQWPWPRKQVSELMLRLARGASVIAFDVVFAEPDGKSPSILAADLPSEGRLGVARGILETLPSYDSVFADAIRAVQCLKTDGTRRDPEDCQPTHVVLGFSLKGEKTKEVPPIRKQVLVKGGSPEIPDFPGAVVPIDALSAAADGFGSITPFPDHDGVIRRVPMIYRMKGRLYPSLALEALRLAQGPQAILGVVGVSEDEGYGETTGISSVRVGKIYVPTDYKGQVLIHFTETAPGRTIPAREVFSDDFDPARLGGGIVFIGTSAAGLKDQRATPLDPGAAGVTLHAQVAEQVLLEHYLYRPDWAEGAEMVFFIALGILLIFLMRKFGAMLCAFLTAGTVAGLFFVSWKAFSGAFGDKQILIDPLYPSIVVMLVYFSSSLVRFLVSEAEKRQVRGAFGRYLSPALVEQLADDPSKLTLGGQMRPLTLMFSDIRGFTTISEQFDAAGLTAFINAYLTPMTDIVLKQKGTIDKYMGDCIMAFWNAPLDDPEHAKNAARAALTMRARLNELNEQWEAEAKAEGRKYIPIRAGIGLNSGDCCVGNMGADQRFDYSVLGDEVNLASRLEGQSKGYGVDIVIGQNTRELIPDFAYIELDLIQVKGKTVPVRIYCLLGDPDVAASPEFKELAENNAAMIEAYRGKRFDEAERLIAECRKADFPLGKFYDLYQSRIDAFRKEPPPEDWNGVFVATTK